MVEDGRIELPLHACKAHVLPLSLIPQKTGLGSRNRTYALSSQTTSDTISPYRVIYTGAP